MTLISLKDIHAYINSDEYCKHSGKTTLVSPYKVLDIEDLSLHTTVVENCYTVLNTANNQSLRSIVRMLSTHFGEPLKDVGYRKKYLAKVAAVPQGKYYFNTKYSQPLHADEGYRNIFPRFVSLYCVRPAATGGMSTLVMVNELLTALKKVFKEDVKNLYLPDFIKIDSHCKGLYKQIFFRLNQKIVGMSYSPIMRSLQTTELGYEMISFINQFIHDPNNQYRFSLQKNDLLIMDNCQVLHGRTRFDDHDSNRLLVRLWNNLITL